MVCVIGAVVLESIRNSKNAAKAKSFNNKDADQSKNVA